MIMPGPEESYVRSTGGQVDEMVMALIDAAFDKDQNVRQIICTSLFELGKKQPALVLSSAHSYLVKHTKLTMGHRVVILNSMEAIVKDTIEEMDGPLAVDIIKQASAELTQSKDVLPEWQTSASNVMVAVGCQYCNEVMDELHQKFQPGVLPHFFTVQTMANLASANVFGMVPFLKAVLGTMLPMLGMAKADNMRWVFSFALAKFSEAILDYVANIEKAPDPAVKKEAFESEIYSAYDILFNVWLQSREAKVRLAIVDAIGQMTHIMSREKLQEQLPRLLPGICSLYKKGVEAYHVTQGLCMILDAATEEGSTILEPHFDQLLNVLFPQICQPMDYSSPMTVKNHNELLRCFAVLAKSFSDRLVAYLLGKIEPTSERSRIGVLSIIRHLINSAGDQMENKKALILSGCKLGITDPSNKVKKVLAQTVVAMGHHGYLELEGGQLMLEFIIRQCALHPEPPGKRPPDPDYVSNDALKSMCDNVLQLLSTTVENMDQVLWPCLFEYLVPDHNTGAICSLCRSIANVAERKRETKAEDFEIDFDKEDLKPVQWESAVNLPKPTAILSRLLVMAGHPLAGKNRGLHVLTCMKAIGPLVHDNLTDLWDTVVPKLIQYMEDALERDDEFSQKNWEDLVLKLLSKSLDQVDDEEWVNSLADSMGQQVTLYNNNSHEKNFLYKCLGITLRKSVKKELVGKQMDILFTTVKHSSQLEREGCAIATGFAAASHLDLVLTKLEGVSKNETTSATKKKKVPTATLR